MKNEIELQVLSLFCKSRLHFAKYSERVRFSEIMLQNIFEQIKVLYLHTSENHINKENLDSVIKIAQFDEELYSRVVEDIYQVELNEELIQYLLTIITNKYKAYQVYSKINSILEEGTFEDISELSSILGDDGDEDQQEDVVSLSLEDLSLDNEGIYWPWSKVNDILGPVPLQTHGLIAAPVETGKTAFLTNSVLHFRRQGAKVLHLNNEDPKYKVLERYYINYFGVTYDTIRADIDRHSSIFREAHDGGLVLIDQPDTTAFKLEQYVKIHKPDIVVIDQLDHMSKDVEAASLERLYYRVRTIGKRQGTRILSVTQAAYTTNDFISLEDLHYSKVGKQSQLDYMIGIKAPAGYPLLRNISFPKNKLKGNHGSCVMRWNPALLQYEE